MKTISDIRRIHEQLKSAQDNLNQEHASLDKDSYTELYLKDDVGSAIMDVGNPGVGAFCLRIGYSPDTAVTIEQPYVIEDHKPVIKTEAVECVRLEYKRRGAFGHILVPIKMLPELIETLKGLL